MKKTISMLIVLTMALCLFSAGMTTAYAQGNTKIIVMVEDNKTEVQTGDTFKVYIKAEQALDLFGLQLTLNYDPSMIQVVENGINIEPNMKVFGGEEINTQEGRITYPFINEESKKELIESMPIADITFEALKKGPVIITLTNVKAVNSDVEEIHYNTQYQTVLNIREPAPPVKVEQGDPGVQRPSDDNGGGSKDPVDPEESGTSDNEGDAQDPDGLGDSEGDTGDKPADSDKGPSDTPGKAQSGDDGTPGDQAEKNEKSKDAKKSGGNTVLFVILGLVVLALAGGGVYAYMNKDKVKELLDKVTAKFKKDTEV